MPLRNMELDTGFSGYTSARPELPAPAAERSSRVGIGALLSGDLDTFNAITDESLETLGAGFRMENDILNTVSLLTRPQYKADPSFDLSGRLKADGLWNDYSQNFVGVESEQEYLAISGRITQENKDRATLAAAGTGGMIAAMAAGLLSPTALLPFVGGLRGGRALVAGVAAGAAGGAVQELPLQLAQETRSMEESVSSIAMSTVLGGVLGGAVGFMRRPIDEVADLLVQADMVPAPGAQAISGNSARAAGGGAAARLEEAPRLASAFGMEDNVGKISPVVRTLTSNVDQARFMMSQLADAGLEFDGRAVAAVGGNAENRIKTYYGPVDRVFRGMDDAYARYMLGDGAQKPLAVKRAQLAGMNPKRAKFSRQEFKREIARALQNNDQHAIPEVTEVASMMRKEIYDPIFKRAQEAGLYKAIQDGDGTVPGDLSYLNRVYNTDMIQARQTEFEEILAAHYEGKLSNDFREAWGRLTGQEKRATERIEDFSRSPEEVEELREQFEEQLRQLNEGRNAELVELEDAISDKRSAARTFDSGTPERARANEEARALEQAGGEALAQTRTERANIRRRLNNLRRAHSALTARQEAKLDKIGRAEELSFNTLTRLVRKGQRVLKDFDKVSDAKLDGEVSKLRTQFTEAGARFDRNEERIADSMEDEWWQTQETVAPNQPSAEELKGYVNTRGRGERFHGSPSPIALDVEGHYSTLNYYGQGLYSTDAMDVAEGYAKRGKSKDQYYYRINEKNPVVFNMEEPVPDWLIAGEGDLVQMAAEEATNVRQLYDEIRDISRSEGYSADDVQEIFAVFRERFEERGFNTLEHVGGLRTKSPEHNVRIYLNDDAAGIEQIDNAVYKQPEASPLTKLDKMQRQQLGLQLKLDELAERLDMKEGFDREAARSAIQEGLDEATKRAQGIVERRAVRSAKLKEQAQALDPAAAAQRIDDMKSEGKLRRTEFLDQWRERGADDIDPVTGVSSFKRFSGEAARATANKILKTYMRLPGMDMIAQMKGAELARVLDIPSNLLVSKHGESFLEMDAEKLAMMYVRTLAPDIELSRAFGPDFMGKRDETAGELNENWKKLDDEMNARRERVQGMMEQGLDPRTGKPKTYTQEQIDKAGQELAEDYEGVRRDLEAVIGRLRHTWGVPNEPRGLGARAARIASNVNVLRFMSNVAISSIPDIARPVQKYGLLRTFRDGWVPFVKGLAELKFTPRQLKVAGAALDLTLHSRALQMYDIGDYMVRGSKFEKGLDYATSKIGLLGLFDYWTVAMKQISGSVTNARAMDALDIVAGGAKASQRDIEEATRFLSANGIDDDYARRIWAEMQNGGGEKVGGQWWPNTEDWVDQDAVTAYNAMLTREVDNSIITPGVERPLLMDVNPFMKLLTQFKSFGMSSTTKTFLAGAQSMRQGDMAFVTGGLISLALGALSYYTYANVAGGPTKERMNKALAEGDWEIFADEAINRSGLLGVGADIQSLFATTPAADYVTFSGERSTRRGGDNLWETLAGPTAGDLGPRVANIVAGGFGGDLAEQDIRRLMPLQNHFALRRLYDQIEAAAK